MAILSVIRRWRLRDGMAIREIVRRTGLSRNTIRKYLANGVVEPSYARRKSPSKLDEYAQILSSWLQRESLRHRKQRRNLRQLYSDLLALGYTGSYDRVAAFARVWRQQQAEATKVTGRGVFVPLQFAPGEAFQFDWSEDWAGLSRLTERAPVVTKSLFLPGCYGLGLDKVQGFPPARPKFRY